MTRITCTSIIAVFGIVIAVSIMCTALFAGVAGAQFFPSTPFGYGGYDGFGYDGFGYPGIDGLYGMPFDAPFGTPFGTPAFGGPQRSLRDCLQSQARRCHTACLPLQVRRHSCP